MLLRSAVALLTLAGTIAGVGGACSSSNQRDQNYGKDVATTYVEPDGGLRDLAAAQDAGTDASADAGTNDADRMPDPDASDAPSDGAPG